MCDRGVVPHVGPARTMSGQEDGFALAVRGSSICCLRTPRWTRPENWRQLNVSPLSQATSSGTPTRQEHKHAP